MQGETVSFQAIHDTGGAAGAAIISILNGRGAARTLLSTEQVVVDDITLNMATSIDVVDPSPLCEIYSALNILANITDPGVVLLGSFGGQGDGTSSSNMTPGFNSLSFKHEGFACPPGAGLAVRYSFAGQSYRLEITGTGRIVNSTQTPGRQSWQSKLNP